MMCGPEIGTIMQLASTVTEYKANKSAGAAQQAMYEASAQQDEYNARLSSLQAEDAVDRGALELDKRRKQTRALVAAQRAATGASGQSAAAGSTLQLTQDAEAIGAFDLEIMRGNTQREKWGFDVQTINYQNQARINRAAGTNAKKAYDIAAKTTLLTGASAVADRWKQSNK